MPGESPSTCCLVHNTVVLGVVCEFRTCASDGSRHMEGAAVIVVNVETTGDYHFDHDREAVSG